MLIYYDGAINRDEERHAVDPKNSISSLRSSEDRARLRLIYFVEHSNPSNQRGAALSGSTVPRRGFAVCTNLDGRMGPLVCAPVLVRRKPMLATKVGLVV